MKKLIFVTCLLLGGFFVSNAQTEYKATTEGWLVDLEEARELSNKLGKPILANFTGSDWCGWCIRLKKNVFVTDEFKKWADENVILLELDFPKRKSIPTEYENQNRDLQQVFKVRGFPTIWIFNMIDAEGDKNYKINALGRGGYKSTPKEFISDMDKIIENASLNSKSSSTTPKSKT